MINKPATESAVAQGGLELATPVSLLGDDWWTLLPTPVSLLVLKARYEPRTPLFSDILENQGRTDVRQQECQECATPLITTVNPMMCTPLFTSE